MNGRLLLIVRSGLARSTHVGESVDAALVCAAFGMEVSVMFEGDGLGYLQDAPFSELFELADADDFANMFALIQPDATLQQGVRRMTLPRANREFAAHQHILVA